jgi:RNA polymerase sigma-70 factor (ECF subfamily)
MPSLSLAHQLTEASEQEDASLVRAAQRDRAAFAPLYDRYVTRVYRYLYSRIGDAHAAEDATAQVFTEALAGLGGYREQGRFAPWLLSIARRRAADYHRRRDHAPLEAALAQPGEQDPLAKLVREEELRRLAELVGALDEEARELLRLRFAAGLTYGEIGGMLGRSEDAVKMAVHRLLRRLQRSWELTDGPQ